MNRATDHAGILGDGLHDDTTAIQALLDAGASAVYLPPPLKHYLISRTLVIHSGQTLRLDPFTVIRLAPHSDTVMITNDDHDQGNESIALVGGENLTRLAEALSAEALPGTANAPCPAPSTWLARGPYGEVGND